MWLFDAIKRRITPHVPSAFPILQEIDRRGLEISAFSTNYSGRGWVVILKYKNDDVDCEVKGRGETFDIALASAWDAWPGNGATP